MKNQLKGIVLDQETLGKIQLPIDLLNLASWQFHQTTNENEVVDRIAEVDIILTNKVILSSEILAKSKVKYIGILATGTNNVDLDYCQANGIEVKNAVGYSTDSVAQHTFTMLLSFLGRPYYFDNYVKTGGYAQSPTFTHLGHEFHEIKGKTWGIIGLGAIGAKVAEIASVFGAEIVYYSTSNKDRNVHYQRFSLEDLLANADIISIHAPLNSKTLGLVNNVLLNQMKPHAILVNAGRGGIVVENDLIHALNHNKIAGACLDVFENEPFDFKEKYASLKNPDKLLLSPHIAWASVESRQALLEITSENLKNWINK